MLKIMVSACLLGEHCKYNGGSNLSDKVLKYVSGHEVVPVCPEVLGGLSVPRLSAEIVNGVVTASDGHSVDREFRRGAAIAFKRAIREKVDLVILQSRSPSCGVKEVYDGSFSGKKVKGQGIFAAMLKAQGIPVIDLEDL